MDKITEQEFLANILEMTRNQPITAGQAVYLLGHKYGIALPLSEEEVVSLHEMGLMDATAYDTLINNIPNNKTDQLKLFDKWWASYPSRGAGKVKGVRSVAKSRFLGLSSFQVQQLIRATELVKTKYKPSDPKYYQTAQVFISSGYQGIMDSEEEAVEVSDMVNTSGFIEIQNKKI